jgi:hypothetical protein
MLSSRPALLSGQSAEHRTTTGAEDDDVSMWSDRVSEPFRSNERFWHSLVASVGAVLALVAASVVSAVVGGVAVVAYAVPLLLLAVAAASARSSSAVTRPQFASRDQWREAEREAVARALMLRRAARDSEGRELQS